MTGTTTADSALRIGGVNTDWLASAQPLVGFQLKARLSAHPKLYTGDPNDGSQFDLPRFQLTLPELSFRKGGDSYVTRNYVDVEDVLANIDEYVTYLRILLEETYRAGRTFSGTTYHHTFHLTIAGESGEDELALGLADHVQDIESILTWIREEEPWTSQRDIYSDLDQGYSLCIVRTEDDFAFRQGDFQFAENPSGTSWGGCPPDGHVASFTVQKDVAIAQFDRAVADMQTVAARLTEAVGADVWTTYAYDEPNFGTPDWSPESDSSPRTAR